jgi:hypothetical protein
LQVADRYTIIEKYQIDRKGEEAMTDERKRNPIKAAAIDLVHMMDYMKNPERLRPYERELFREEYNLFIRDLMKKGYDMSTLLALGEEYKTLNLMDYREWVYI